MLHMACNTLYTETETCQTCAGHTLDTKKSSTSGLYLSCRPCWEATCAALSSSWRWKTALRWPRLHAQAVSDACKHGPMMSGKTYTSLCGKGHADQPGKL